MCWRASDPPPRPQASSSTGGRERELQMQRHQWDCHRASTAPAPGGLLVQLRGLERPRRRAQLLQLCPPGELQSNTQHARGTHAWRARFAALTMYGCVCWHSARLGALRGKQNKRHTTRGACGMLLPPPVPHSLYNLLACCAQQCVTRHEHERLGSQQAAQVSCCGRRGTQEKERQAASARRLVSGRAAASLHARRQARLLQNHTPLHAPPRHCTTLN
jgi:hypothetical protein